jgi:hypothetical protein
MLLFLQIFLSSAALVAFLICVHEIGHWVFGRLVGIPADQMRIRLFDFPQRVELRSQGRWLTVDDFDSYFAQLGEWTRSVSTRFAFVAGGFAFETLALILITISLARSGLVLFAAVAPGVSLAMYLIYVFVLDLPHARRRAKPYGDSTILFAIAPNAAAAVAALMVGVRTALILAAVFGWINPTH